MQTMDSQIKHYLEVGKYEKKLSPDTLKAYSVDLRQFWEYTSGAWGDTATLEEYIRHLNETFAPRSVKRKLASVRAFYREMYTIGVLESDPFDRLRVRVHSPKQLPRIIPLETVHDILEKAYAAYMPERKRILRDIFVLETLFSTGLRVSEL